MKNRSETNKEATNIPKTPRVSIVDDDESVREAIKSLLRSIGFGADAFASAEEFLNSDYQHNAECLIVDVRMPGISGLKHQVSLPVFTRIQRSFVAGWNRLPIWRATPEAVS